ncbi:pH-response regulator protein palA/rim20, partial [Dispira parvispora]
FRISRECLEHNRYGEEICRLQWAATSVQTLISHPMVQGVPNSPTGELRGNMDSDTLPGTINWDLVRQRLQYETETLHHVLQDLESLRTTLTTNLQRAEKDNDIIYLDHVPEFSSLPPVTGVSLVNPQIPAEISDSMAYMGSTTVLGTPLLAGLLPFAVHQAVSLYHDRKQQLVATQVVEPLETLSVQCQSFIESLDLNYLIASTRTPTDIPSTITQAAQDVQKRGGYTFLDKHLAAAHALAQRCTEELTNCQHKLANLPQDTSSFSPQRESVPGYYPSASSTEDPQVGERGTIWREQYRAHERALQDAQTNDKALRKRLTAWQPFIQLLEGPSAQLVAALPSTIGVTLLPSERNVIDEVATLLQELRRRCVHDRPVFMDKVRLVCDQDDIGPALTKTLHQLSLSSSATLLKVEPYQFEDTFSDQLQKYNPHIQHVQREEELQNTLMTRLTGLRQHIVALRDKYPPLVQREKAYHNLSTACQKFQELITLGSEVQQFYRNLEEQLHSLASEILPG